MESEFNISENSIALKLSSDIIPRITIKVFYFPHSLEWQIVQGGLPHLFNQKSAEGLSKKGPHEGLRDLSLELSCSIEETIIKSVQENWLIEHTWYQDLKELLNHPNFS